MHKAVKSLGEDRAGETPPDSRAGVMDTQNTALGLKTGFGQVSVVAGNHIALGQATLYRIGGAISGPPKPASVMKAATPGSVALSISF